MEYRKLGRTGLEVSSLGLGCVTFGREIDAETSFQILDYALERGINLYDTAEAYGAGASETLLGQWIDDRGVRDKIVLASKFYGTLTRQNLRDSVNASLQRLKTDRIDLFQLHNWDEETPVEETLDTLTELVQEGKILFCACSNWSAWQLAKALIMTHERGVARLESVQPPYNLVQREIEADLIPLCQDQQVGVLSYSPLGAGFLTGKYREGGEVPAGTRFDVIPGHQPIYFTPTGWRVMEHLRAKAAEMGRSMVELALNWTVHQPGITSMLVGAREIRHVDQAFDAESAEISTAVREELSQD